MIEMEMARISNDIARLQEGINHYGLHVRVGKATVVKGILDGQNC